jgi:CheY-like chemotaxis protein
VGLCVALSIAADAGGGITLENRPGSGLTARVYLPLENTCEQDSDCGDDMDADDVDDAVESSVTVDCVTELSTTSNSKATYVGRVLMVDDEQPILDVFTMMLREELPGIEINTALNGELGLEQFKAIAPDVVILDLHMPNMDGLTLFKHMDKCCREDGQKMPKVIFCTGYAAPNEFESILSNSDAQYDVLYKPVRTKDLVGCVSQGVSTE